MDRRLRSPSRKPRIEERLHRFLRPGALARLRDSKIIARSLRSAPVRLLPPSSPPPSAAPSLAEDGVPHFLGARASGAPRYPLRKKLAAARAVLFLPPSAGPEAVDVFVPSSDLVAAH